MNFSRRSFFARITAALAAAKTLAAKPLRPELVGSNSKLIIRDCTLNAPADPAQPCTRRNFRLTVDGQDWTPYLDTGSLVLESGPPVDVTESDDTLFRRFVLGPMTLTFGLTSEMEPRPAADAAMGHPYPTVKLESDGEVLFSGFITKAEHRISSDRSSFFLHVACEEAGTWADGGIIREQHGSVYFSNCRFSNALSAEDVCRESVERVRFRNSGSRLL